MATTSGIGALSRRNWKQFVLPDGPGRLSVHTADTGEVPVRLFFSPSLFDALEDDIYPQIVNATRFPGVKMVVLTPDAHIGYGVPVGSVILTDAAKGAVAMGPVGFDIGCGMVHAESDVSASAATRERRLHFNKEVLRRVAMGAGEASRTKFRSLRTAEFEAIIRGGAEHYAATWPTSLDRDRAERDRLPVDDAWAVPWGSSGRPERGIPQLGSLGGGNHFIELQRSRTSDRLHVQVHTGSRGFGHGLATNYFGLAQAEQPSAGRDIDLGYFTPDSPRYGQYLNAVSAGGNFAIVNRLIIMEEVAAAFRATFRRELRVVY